MSAGRLHLIWEFGAKTNEIVIRSGGIIRLKHSKFVRGNEWYVRVFDWRTLSRIIVFGTLLSLSLERIRSDKTTAGSKRARLFVQAGLFRIINFYDLYEQNNGKLRVV